MGSGGPGKRVTEVGLQHHRDGALMNQRLTKAERLQAGEIIVSRESGNSMVPVIKHRQPVRIAPATWEEVEKGDIVFCRVRGHYYTHLVKAKNEKRGCLIGNNTGHNNGWTKAVFGKVIEILPMSYKGAPGEA